MKFPFCKTAVWRTCLAEDWISLAIKSEIFIVTLYKFHQYLIQLIGRETFGQMFFLTLFLFLWPSEQQRGLVRCQRDRCGYALLCWHLPLRGHRPRPPWGGGWRPQPRSHRRERGERTQQGGGGSSGAGLPHSPGAVRRSPPLDPAAQDALETGVQGKEAEMETSNIVDLNVLLLVCRWTSWTRLWLAAGMSHDSKLKLKQGTNDAGEISCCSDDEAHNNVFFYFPL